jgi:tetratricopeptide (TPR) repeat protein
MPPQRQLRRVMGAEEWVSVSVAAGSEFERLLSAAQAGLAARCPREAQAPAEAALAIAQAGQSSSLASRTALARAALAVAGVRGQLGDWGEAETLARRAVAGLDAGPDGGIADCAVEGVAALGALGEALRAQGRYAEAEASLRDSLVHAESAQDGELLIVQAANGLAVLYKYTARFDEAEALYRRALDIVDARRAPRHVDAATLWHNLAGLDHSRGRHARAEPAARRAVEIRTRALGAVHPDVAADAAALGAILDALGRVDEAEELIRSALETFTTLLGPCHYEVAINTNNLAALQYRRGRIDDAEALWHQALTTSRNSSEKTIRNSRPRSSTSASSPPRGRDDDARTHFERALELLGHGIAQEHPVHRVAIQSLAKLAERAPKQTRGA